MKSSLANFNSAAAWPVVGLIACMVSACGPGVDNISYVAIPTAASGAAAITCDRFATIWFTESAVGKIGTITHDSKMVEYSLPHSDSQPEGISGDGYYVWFTESRANKVGRILTNGSIEEFDVPSKNAEPYGIQGEDDGAWFVETASNRVGHVSLAGRITEYVIPTPNSQPADIAENYDSHTLWFTEFRGNKIGEIDHRGRIREFPLPRANSSPVGLVYQYWGVHPPMWIGEGVGQLASISQQGRITEYSVPGHPIRIKAIENGALVYGDSQAPSIGLIMSIPNLNVSREFEVAHAGQIADLASCNGEVWATDPELNEILRITVYVPTYP